MLNDVRPCGSVKAALTDKHSRCSDESRVLMWTLICWGSSPNRTDFSISCNYLRNFFFAWTDPGGTVGQWLVRFLRGNTGPTLNPGSDVVGPSVWSLLLNQLMGIHHLPSERKGEIKHSKWFLKVKRRKYNRTRSWRDNFNTGTKLSQAKSS